MMSLERQRALVVGGSSGIGLATAALMLRQGAEIWISGRSTEKLRVAQSRLGAGNRLTALPFDMTDEAAVERAIAELPEDGVDHLVITASQAVHGAFDTLAVDDAEAMFAAKFWGPYRVAKTALRNLRDGGSITFFSGVLSRRPGLNCTALGAVNAAVEGLTRGLALELGPRLRVNCVSPGMVRTEAYSRMPEEKRGEMYEETGVSLPVGRVGEPEEIAEAVLFAATNPYLTGQVIDIDGGHMIRQYATQ